MALPVLSASLFRVIVFYKSYCEKMHVMCAVCDDLECLNTGSDGKERNFQSQLQKI